jgi:hypothetical protein
MGADRMKTVDALMALYYVVLSGVLVRTSRHAMRSHSFATCETG